MTAEQGDSRFGLDPARLDSCFHGLILLFDDVDSRVSAYLPVRFDEVRLLKPGAALARAHIRIRRRDARVILADFDIFDAEGERAALLRGARYQATRGRADISLSQAGLIRTWLPAIAPLWGSGEEPGRNLQVATGENSCEVELPPDALLVEGWANAAAFELARALSVDGVVDIDELIVTGRLPAERRRWAASVFGALQTSGLIEHVGGAHRISDQTMPSAETIFASLAAQHPHRAAEILLAAHMGATLRDFSRGAGLLTGAPEAAREAFESRSPTALAAARALGARLKEMAKATAPNAPALRILQIGHGAATAETLRFAAERGAWVTILDLDARQLERGRISHGPAPETAFCGDLDALPNDAFDLIVSAGGMSALSAKRGALGRVVEKCASNAALVAVELAPSLFQDLVFGLDEDWFGDEGARLRSAEEWSALFARSGLGMAEARFVATDVDPAILLFAQAPAKAAKTGFAGEVIILREPREVDPFADTLKEALLAGGAACRFARPNDITTLKKTGKLLWLASEAKGDGVAWVAAHCLALKDLALRPSAGKLQILATVRGVDGPAAEAVFSFVRTLANEAPTIDFRRIAISGESPEIAKRLAGFVLSNADETDVAILDDGVKALRYHALEIAQESSGDPQGLRTYRLEKGVDGGFGRLKWRPVLRVAPKAGEVEVEIVATGLNFRDVMWSLSVLPDEMLEDGFAGPTLGLEFSGRVTRIGADVTNLRAGDDVAGFCGGSFSAYVTVDADHVAPLPASISCEAAATIPVAFLTAYYGLITCADLQRGEWVLIHGGAGGVGLAALADRAMARRARHRDRGLAGKTRSRPRPRRGIRFRFSLRRFRRRGRSGDGRARRRRRLELARRRGDGAKPRAA